MAHTSYWQSSTTPAELPRLASDATVDVCIIGAGMAGLSAAYHLSRAGRKVLVMDDNPIGGGETGRTTGHLTNAIDDRYFLIERMHGAEAARLCAESHTAAIHTIEHIARENHIDCDFQRLDGFLFLPPGEDPKVLERELEATHRAGLTEVRRLARVPISFGELGPCLQFPQQGQFHSLKYLNGLARVIRERGGEIVRAHMSGLEEEQGLLISTKAGQTVRAESAIVATNTPVHTMVAMHTKQAAYRTYVVGARVPSGAVPPGLYWDTSQEAGDLDGAYHYVRLQLDIEDGFDLLIIGGEDHKTGQDEMPEERFARLQAWASSIFPMIVDYPYRWSGQVMEPVDHVAFIGRSPGNPDNVYLATGDSGMGLTHGAIAGLLLTDLILGAPNPWEKLYDPARKALRAVGEFARENLNVAAKYAEWVLPGEVKSDEEILPGHGAVMREGLSFVAVYRDPGGRPHRRSAVCPHLGCIVHWNSAEKSWDCPCHGSRFDPLGHVLNGPANTDLPAVESGERPS